MITPQPPLGTTSWPTLNRTAPVPDHDPAHCPSQQYAIACGDPMTADAFDCLRCHWTFRAEGAAHVVGTEWLVCPRAPCRCCWDYLVEHREMLARARRRWRVQGIQFSNEESALQLVELRIRAHHAIG